MKQIKLAKMGTNHSLMDAYRVVFSNKDMDTHMVLFNIVEYNINELGERTKGSKAFAKTYMSISDVSMLARDIVHMKMNLWEAVNDSFKLYFNGGGNENGQVVARKMIAAFYPNTRQFSFTIEEGEGVRRKNAYIMKNVLKRAYTYVSLHDARLFFNNLLDYTNAISFVEVANNTFFRWKVENGNTDESQTIEP
jgi:hypothetical protein